MTIMIYSRLILWFAIILFLPDLGRSKSSFRFNNIKCDDYDISFSRFEKCKLSVKRRGVISLDITGALYKAPVTNVTVNVAFYKRANGFRPFLYNFTHDMCAFLANRNKYPVLKVITSIFLKHSNVNHTCPYSGKLIVKDLVLEEDMFRYLPLPSGEYMLKIQIIAYGDLKSTIQVFFTCTE